MEISLNEPSTTLFHTRKDTGNTSIITGFHKGEISVGDILVFNTKDKHTITEVIERRNHACVFSNPQDKVSTFYKVKTSFQKQI